MDMSKCGKKSAIKKGLGNVQNSFPIIFDDFHLSTFDRMVTNQMVCMQGIFHSYISYNSQLYIYDSHIPMSNFGLVCLKAKQSILTGDRIYHMLHIYVLMIFQLQSEVVPRQAVCQGRQYTK